MTIVTPRLELRPFTPRLAAAHLQGKSSFFAELSAAPCKDWPPPVFDRTALLWTLGRLSEGDDPRWHARIVTTRRRPLCRIRLLGVAGFKGPPDGLGEVEIGYAIVSSAQRRGLGSEAVAALLAFARSHEAVRLVSAHALADAEGAASRRLLERRGFRGPLSTDEPGIVRYELPCAGESAPGAEAIRGRPASGSLHARG